MAKRARHENDRECCCCQRREWMRSDDARFDAQMKFHCTDCRGRLICKICGHCLAHCHAVIRKCVNRHRVLGHGLDRIEGNPQAIR
jgi:hypothetical protein